LVDFEGFIASNFEGYVTKLAPHTTLKLIAWEHVDFEEMT